MNSRRAATPPGTKHRCFSCGQYHDWDEIVVIRWVLNLAGIGVMAAETDVCLCANCIEEAHLVAFPPKATADRERLERAALERATTEEQTRYQCPRPIDEARERGAFVGGSSSSVSSSSGRKPYTPPKLTEITREEAERRVGPLPTPKEGKSE